MPSHLESIFDLARFWQRKNSSRLKTGGKSAASATSAPSRVAVVFYDASLNIVHREEAIYELSFYDTLALQWRLLKGAPSDTARFSIRGYTMDWGEEQWAEYPSNVAVKLIPQLLRDPRSSCHAAFEWLHQDWPTRFRHFLSTHRGVLGDCERVLIWLA